MFPQVFRLRVSKQWARLKLTTIFAYLGRYGRLSGRSWAVLRCSRGWISLGVFTTTWCGLGGRNFHIWAHQPSGTFSNLFTFLVAKVSSKAHINFEHLFGVHNLWLDHSHTFHHPILTSGMCFFGGRVCFVLSRLLFYIIFSLLVLGGHRAFSRCFGDVLACFGPVLGRSIFQECIF